MKGLSLSTSEAMLIGVQEGCCGRAQEAETAGLAPSHSSSLACKQQHQTGHSLSSTGKPNETGGEGLMV